MCACLKSRRRVRPAFLFLAFVLLLAGCRTTPKIDWNSRVGHFTYDQAVVELGPPDKSAKLTDGTLLAEWLTSRGYRHGTFYNFGGIWGVGQIDEMQTPDYFLRLTFAPDGQLRSWKRVVR